MNREKKDLYLFSVMVFLVILVGIRNPKLALQVTKYMLNP